MSGKEIDRLRVIQKVASKHLSQAQAAALLRLSVRQVKRLLKRYRASGAQGLVSGHRGQRPNNALVPEVRERAIALVRELYPDFGPTFACEKLVTVHGLRLSVETLRQWMIADGLWQVRPRRVRRVQQCRPRRPAVGELVQVDGSEHAWFEDRGQRCTLIVFVDDATSQLLALRFAPAETTRAYMETLEQYLAVHGRPVAIYSDRHSIFRVNRPDCEGQLTQFTRALRTLDVDAIHANSPQAKGRVERANGTLQDRLVKELRLAGINDIDAANAFLPAFMADYNDRFGKAPASPVDAHRPVLHDAGELALIFSIHATRKLSRQLTFQYRGCEYQLQGYGRGYRLQGASVTVCQAFDGQVTVLRDGQALDWRLLEQGEPPIPLDDEKSVRNTVSQAKALQQTRQQWKPPVDHPWNRMARQAVAVAADRAASDP